MKTVKILVALALMAGGTANAVTVSLGTATGTSAVNLVPPGGAVGSAVAGTAYSTLTFTQSSSSVTASSYFWQQGTAPANTWQRGAVNFATSSSGNANHAGIGVGATGPQNTNRIVDSGGSEFILLDFGSTVRLDSMTMFINSITTPYYFSYAWLNSAPVNNDTTPDPRASGVTLALTTPFYYWDTSAPASYPDPTPGAYSGAGNYTFNFSTYGSGRYLMLGSSDMSATNLETNFRVNSVTFTSVPEGSQTLVLLGAAVGALGLASRRRRF